MTTKPVKMVNIANDLLQQQAGVHLRGMPPLRANPDGEERRQTKTCMQTAAIAESVRILQEHEQSESGGLPGGPSPRQNHPALRHRQDPGSPCASSKN